MIGSVLLARTWSQHARLELEVDADAVLADRRARSA
jgi:hypothetical protein